MKQHARKTNTLGNIGAALMLTLGLGIAGCGQQTAPGEIDLDAVQGSSPTTVPNGKLSAKSLGTVANGHWNGNWNWITHSRPLNQFSGLVIENGIQSGSTLKHSFERGGDVLLRTGAIGEKFSTAYLVRVPGATDRFEGWYTAYTPAKLATATSPATPATGAIAYYEMKRNRRSLNVDGNDWSGRFDFKPLEPLSTEPRALQNTTSFPAPGGLQVGINVGHYISGNALIRTGTYPWGNTVEQTGGYLIAIPGTQTYLGWYGNSGSQAFNVYVATKGTQVGNNTNWKFEYIFNPPAANSSQKAVGQHWKTSGAGLQTGTTDLKYTTDASSGEMFRTGLFNPTTPSAAHLVRSFKTGQAQGLSNGTDRYIGWYAVDGQLNYYDASKGVTFKGASIAGLEFGTNYAGAGPSTVPGVLNQDYWAPRDLDINTYLKQGMNTIRIPFRWERLQYAASNNNTPLNTPGTDPLLNQTYLAELDRIVNTATSQGANVILDMHNYGSYYRYAGPTFDGYNGIGVTGSSVTSANLATIWYVIADRYKSNPRVMFGLMNEPLYQDTNRLRVVTQDAINAIRQSGAINPILVNGNYFTGAWSWNYGSFGLPSGLLATPGNENAMMSLVDPQDNLIYEAHQYFDPGFSGTPNNAECNPTNGAGQQVNGILASDTIATKVAKLFAPFTNSMRANGKRGFLGEVGVWQSPTCQAYLRETMKYLEANNDVWTGWAYWAAGSKWDAANEMVLQVGDNYTSRPQLNVLKEFLPQP